MNLTFPLLQQLIKVGKLKTTLIINQRYNVNLFNTPFTAGNAIATDKAISSSN